MDDKKKMFKKPSEEKSAKADSKKKAPSGKVMRNKMYGDKE